MVNWDDPAVVGVSDKTAGAIRVKPGGSDVLAASLHVFGATPSMACKI
jgi:hypothetical protein